MLADLFSALLPSPVLAAAGAVAGAAVGVWLPPVAARRTIAQPVAFALEDETTVLAGVLGDLRRFPYLATLTPAEFAVNAHHNIWAALLDVLGADAQVPDKASEAECAALGAQLSARQADLLTALQSRLAYTSAPDIDAARLHQLLTHADEHGYGPGASPEQAAAADADIVTAAEAVIAAGNDRNLYSGVGLILPTANPNSLDADNPPLARAYTAPTSLRRALTVLATAGVGALLPGVAAVLPTTGPATVLAVLALAILTVTSVLIALVDIDTLYIDTRVWAVGSVTGWVAAAAAALAAGHPIWVAYGAAMVAAVAIMFEGSNLIFRLLRGRDGQGFGDTLVLLLTVGLPPVVTGDYRLGVWSVLGALFAGIFGWIVFALAGKVNRHTPFAFGPWLAAGWVIALVWFTYNQHFLGSAS